MSQLLRMGTTYRQFALMATENNSIPISDVNTKDPTMRMTEGDRVKITVYNSNSSKPPHSLHMHQSIQE
jgi:FtsP/CotA-like multicopper oxidase with cupredoxin domain